MLHLLHGVLGRCKRRRDLRCHKGDTAALCDSDRRRRKVRCADRDMLSARQRQRCADGRQSCQARGVRGRRSRGRVHILAFGDDRGARVVGDMRALVRAQQHVSHVARRHSRRCDRDVRLWAGRLDDGRFEGDLDGLLDAGDMHTCRLFAQQIVPCDLRADGPQRKEGVQGDAGGQRHAAQHVHFDQQRAKGDGHLFARARRMRRGGRSDLPIRVLDGRRVVAGDHARFDFGRLQAHLHGRQAHLPRRDAAILRRAVVDGGGRVHLHVHRHPGQHGAGRVVEHNRRGHRGQSQRGALERRGQNFHIVDLDLPGRRVHRRVCLCGAGVDSVVRRRYEHFSQKGRFF